MGIVARRCDGAARVNAACTPPHPIITLRSLQSWQATGIFAGMFSPRDPQSVLDDLGDKFALGFARAVAATRADWTLHRGEHPDWTSGYFQRESANLIHSRLWSHMGSEFEGVAEITLVSKEPLRVVCVQTPVGRTYEMRAKRHSANDFIASYPTLSDITFWSTGANTLDDLERIRLAIGYRWDKVTGEIGVPVISYREEKSNPIWAYTLEDGGAAGAQPVYRPIPTGGPSLPEVVRLGDDDREEQQER